MESASARRFPWAVIGASLVYLMCACWLAIVRPPSHDEGVTYDQTIGAFPLKNGQSGTVADLSRAVFAGKWSVRDVLNNLENRGMHPPAYYLLLRVEARLFGARLAAVRGVGVAFGLAAIWGVYVLGCRALESPTAGVLAAWTLALSPWHWLIASYARPYAMAAVISIWATVWASEWPRPSSERRRTGTLAAHSVLSIIGLYTIYHYVFVVAWHWACMFARCAARSRRALLAAVAATVVAYLPWNRVLAHHLVYTADRFYFSGRWPVHRWPLGLGRLAGTFLFGSSSLLLDVLAAAVLAFAVVLARERSRAGSFWAFAALLPASMLLGDAIRNMHSFFVPKVAFAAAALVVLFVAERVALLGKRERWLAACLLFGLQAAAGARVVKASMAASPFQSAARTVGKDDSPDHVVVISHAARGYSIPFLLDLDAAGVKRARLAYIDKASLAPFVEKELADPGVRRVTAIQFLVYEAAEPDDSTPERLAQIQRRAPAGKRLDVLGPVRRDDF